jgi:hypothetical protein
LISPTQTLKTLIADEYKRIRASFDEDSYYAIQILIRRLDALSLFLVESESQTEDEINESRAYLNFGWGPLLKLFLKDIDFHKSHYFIETSSKDIEWADSVIFYAGKLAFCNQILEYEKAKMVEITNPKNNEFAFRYKYGNTSFEYFDKLSANFYKEEIIERIIKEEKLANPFNEKEIKEKLKAIIRNPHGKFISYQSTEEIDGYYNEIGHYHILRIQGYDDFDTLDMFGSLEYGKYVSLVEIITGVAFRHTEACIELAKLNPSVDIHNILTYMFLKDDAIKKFSDSLGVQIEEIEQIFSCITLGKDNYEYYLDSPAITPPMYFQVSDNQLICSVAGCMANPFKILNSELKRRYKRDYDIAVTKREERFRNELFEFFQQERIIKIPKEINISFNGMKTDIDAIVYDTATKTLGLFQLKWQDSFTYSMKERFSRISNLFPKANEWIEKMKIWLSNNSEKSILNALQITKYFPQAKEIKEIYIFILARNNINFTGVEKDEQVAWGSWYQVIESHARVGVIFDDPIREMFVKLKIFSPEERMTRDEMPELGKFDIQLGDYRIYYSQ